MCNTVFITDGIAVQTCPLQSCRGVRAAVTNSGVQARAPSRRGPRGGSHVARPVADGEAGGAGGRSELRCQAGPGLQARAARPRRASRDVRHLTRTARWHLGVHSAVHPPPLPSSEILPSPPERAACPPPGARSPRPPRPGPHHPVVSLAAPLLDMSRQEARARLPHLAQCS